MCIELWVTFGYIFGMKHRELAGSIISILEGRGITYRVDHRGKHPALTFICGGKAHRVSMSWTSSDRRARLNARALVRRILKRGATQS